MKSDAFPSLEALRSGHSDLLQSVPDSEDKLTESDVGRIREFLRRAAAAGRVIDIPADRKQAQGLLDYWSATLYSQGQRQPVGAAGVGRLPRDETVLAEFESGTVDEVARAADAWFQRVPEGDRDLVRRILLRLVRLPDEGRKVRPLAVPRSTLQQLAPPARVDAILEGLAKAGLIRVEKAEPPEDDRISLRFDALTRSWNPYAGWVDQRVRFRDAASFWDATQEDQTALIRDKLLDEAIDYHDKNELEQKFVAASRDRERSQNRLNLVAKWILAVVATCALGFAGVAWAQWSRANRQAQDAIVQKQLAEAAVQRENEARVAAEAQRQRADEVARRAQQQELAARRAEAALKAKVKLSNMVTITRNLAEIGTAVSDAERQIAVRRLEILSDNLRGDPDFDPIFERLARHLDRVKQGAASSEELERIARQALKVGRDLKGQALQVQDPDLVNELKAQRVVSYQMARYCGEQIVSTFTRHPFTDADHYVEEFWLLYWGELGIVEGPAVQNAMVHFGRKLKEIDKAMESGLPDPKQLLDPQQLERYSSQQLRGKLRTLRSAKLNSKNPAALLTELASHRVRESDAEELSRILEKELIPALERELKGEIAPNHKPPENY